MRNPALAAATVAVAVSITGCTADAARPAPAAPPRVTGPATTPAPTSNPPASRRLSIGRRAPRAAPFSWRAAPVDTAALGRSWRPGCPVGPGRLRAVTLRFWGFDDRPHVGALVVNGAAVRAVVAAFRLMYVERFPIRQMQPVAAYGGSDTASMAADNTSAFNCRYAVGNGPRSWSEHAYGDAVDINPRENPYRLDGRVLPPGGAPYLRRADVRAGMVVAGGVPVRAFDSVGWGWGGRWASSPDYQHFSSTGR